MTLQERLQRELIGEDEHWRDPKIVYAMGMNKAKADQRSRLETTLANIEADLKGLMPSPYTVDQLNAVSSLSSEWAQMVKHNSTVSDVIAAIERYCKGGTK